MLKDDAFVPGVSPPTWLGVMGGGQLGRMFVHAAQAMGFKVAVLEPAPDCPAGHAADRLLLADYADSNALRELAAQCVAVTTEFENVPADSLKRLAATAFVAPAAASVAIAQDRMAEKRFFGECAGTSGVLPAPHHVIRGINDVESAPAALFPGLLKTLRMGYDGKGQIKVSNLDDLPVALDVMQGAACILEKLLPLACEVSVLVARGADGEIKVYPVAENVHRNGILHTTVVPAQNISESLSASVQKAAQAIVDRLDYVGVLCIEFFVLDDGSVVVNEMAPRPHNSGHYTIDACVTSQFAQQVRAMARLPLGEVRQHSPAVMLNLLGDLWFDKNDDDCEPCDPPWAELLALPGVCLHLYGKEQPRRGRKMGHITFVAPSLAEARSGLHAACKLLDITP